MVCMGFMPHALSKYFPVPLRPSGWVGLFLLSGLASNPNHLCFFYCVCLYLAMIPPLVFFYQSTHREVISSELKVLLVTLEDGTQDVTSLSMRDGSLFAGPGLMVRVYDSELHEMYKFMTQGKRSKVQIYNKLLTEKFIWCALDQLVPTPPVETSVFPTTELLKKIVLFQMSNVMFGFVNSEPGSRNDGCELALLHVILPCQQCSLKQDSQKSGTFIFSFCKLRRIEPHARQDVQFTVRRLGSPG